MNFQYSTLHSTTLSLNPSLLSVNHSLQPLHHHGSPPVFTELLPCLCVSDQILDFFTCYFAKHSTELVLEQCVFQVQNQTEEEKQLIQKISDFVQQKRQLGAPVDCSFSFLELLEVVQADEVEWIGSSLNEMLYPYFYKLCEKYLAPQTHLAQLFFQEQLPQWFQAAHAQKMLVKKGMDWDLRLVSQGDLNVQKNKTNAVLNFIQQKSQVKHLSTQALIDHKIVTKRWASQPTAGDRYAMIGLNILQDKPVEFICVSRLDANKVSLKKTHLSNLNCLKVFLNSFIKSLPHTLEVRVEGFSAQEFFIYFLAGVWNVSDLNAIDTATWLRYIRDDGRSTHPQFSLKLIQAVRNEKKPDQTFSEYMCQILEKELNKANLQGIDAFEFVFRALLSLHEETDLKDDFFKDILKWFDTKNLWIVKTKEQDSYPFATTLFELLCIKKVPLAEVSAALVLLCTLSQTSCLSHRDQHAAFHLNVKQGDKEWTCWLKLNLSHALASLNFDCFFQLAGCLKEETSPAVIRSYLINLTAIQGYAEQWKNHQDPKIASIGWQLDFLTLPHPSSQQVYDFIEQVPFFVKHLNSAWLDQLCEQFKDSVLQSEITLLQQLKEIKQHQDFSSLWIKKLAQTQSPALSALAIQLLMQQEVIDVSFAMTILKTLFEKTPLYAMQLFKDLNKKNVWKETHLIQALSDLIKAYDQQFARTSFQDSTGQEIGQLILQLLDQQQLTTYSSDFIFVVLQRLYQTPAQHQTGDTLLVKATKHKILPVKHLESLWMDRLDDLLTKDTSKAAHFWHQAYTLKVLDQFTVLAREQWSQRIQQLLPHLNCLSQPQQKWELIEQKLRLPCPSTEALTLFKSLCSLLEQKLVPPQVIQDWMDKKQVQILATFKKNEYPLEALIFLSGLSRLGVRQKNLTSFVAWVSQSFKKLKAEELVQQIHEEALTDMVKSFHALDPSIFLSLLEHLYLQLDPELVTQSLLVFPQDHFSLLTAFNLKWITFLIQKQKFEDALSLLQKVNYSNIDKEAYETVTKLINQLLKTNRYFFLDELLLDIIGEKIFINQTALFKSSVVKVMTQMRRDMSVSRLEMLCTLVDKYQLEDKYWLDCWKWVNRPKYLEAELSETLWKLFSHSSQMKLTKTDEGVNCWVQAFDYLKRTNHPDVKQFLTYPLPLIEWIHSNQWMKQKWTVYTHLIVTHFNLLNLSFKEDYYKNILNLMSTLNEEAKLTNMDQPSSPFYEFYENYHLDTKIHLALVLSQFSITEDLQKSISILTECDKQFSVNQLKPFYPNLKKIYIYINESFKQLDDLSTFHRCYLQLRSLTDLIERHLFWTFDEHLQMIQHYLNNLTTFENRSQYFNQLSEDPTTLNKNNLQLLKVSANNCLNVIHLFKLLKNSITHPQFKATPTFIAVLQKALKRDWNSVNPEILINLLQLLATHLAKLGLSSSESKDILIQTFKNYLFNTSKPSYPLTESSLYSLSQCAAFLMPHLLADPILFTQALNDYFRGVKLFLIRHQNIDIDLDQTHFLVFKTILDYEANPLHQNKEAKENKAKNLAQFRQQFLVHCQNINIPWNHQAKFLSRLIELGIEKKKPFETILELLEDLIFTLNFSHELYSHSLLDKGVSTTLQRQAYLDDINKSINCIYNHYNKNINDFNLKFFEISYYVHRMIDQLKLPLFEYGSIIKVENINNILNKLNTYKTYKSYKAITNFLFNLKKVEVFDCPEILNIYCELLLAAATLFIRPVGDEEILLKVIYQINPDLKTITDDSVKEKWISLIDLQIPIVYNLLILNKDNLSSELTKKYLLHFFQLLNDHLACKSTKIKSIYYVNNLKELIPIILTLEALNAFDSIIMPSSYYSCSMQWISFFKKVVNKYSKDSDLVLMFSLIKQWFEQAKEIKASIDFNLMSLQEFSINMVITLSDPSYSYSAHQVTSYQTRWDEESLVLQTFSFNYSRYRYCKSYCLDNKIFNEKSKDSLVLFESIYKLNSRHGTPIQQLQLEIVTLFFYQQSMHSNLETCFSRMAKMIEPLPKTGLKGLIYMELLLTIWNRFIYTHHLFEDQKQASFSIELFKMMYQLMLESESEQTPEIKSLIYLNFITSLQQISTNNVALKKQIEFFLIVSQIVELLQKNPHFKAIGDLILLDMHMQKLYVDNPKAFMQTLLNVMPELTKHILTLRSLACFFHLTSITRRLDFSHQKELIAKLNVVMLQMVDSLEDKDALQLDLYDLLKKINS